MKGAMKPSTRGKVAHLTSVHDASDTRIAHKECRTLAQDGYDVVLVAPGPERLLPSAVRHRVVPAPRNRFERFTKTMWQVYRAALDERADVYHFHDPELVAVGAALRLRGARVIFDVHEDLALDIKTKAWIPAAARPAVGAVAGFVLRTVQSWFTAIVPATPSIAAHFSHRRTVVVRNYPRVEELFIEGQAIPYHRRPLTAMYLGSITLVRGVEQMVDAMAHPFVPGEARLLLAGEFETEALRERVAARPGWSRVEAPGRLPRQALASALGRARIGMMVLQPATSFEESLPTKLFEYMGAGLPVIASRFLACRDVIREHECGVLVDPRDPDEIAWAMLNVFNDPAAAAAMGERGRHAIMGRYEWASEARSLCALYQEISR